MSAGEDCPDCLHPVDEHGFDGCVVPAAECSGPTEGGFCACLRPAL